MKQITFFIFLISAHICIGQKFYTFPITSTADTSDTIWHETVKDPYRWLENINSDETKEWLKSQDKLKDKYSGKNYYPLIDYLKYYSHIEQRRILREGKYYFSFKIYDEFESPCLLYKVQMNDEAQLLFDPNKLYKSAVTSIDGLSISEDNKTLALVLSRNSGDWKTIRFLNVENKKLLNDSICFVKYSSISWSGDGIFYVKYDVKNISESFTGLIKGRTLFYHKMDTKQENDFLIYKPENGNEDFKFEVTPKKKYLVLYHTQKKEERTLTILSLMTLPFDNSPQFKDFIVSGRKDIYFDVIGELNDRLLVRTNFNAKNGAIYKYDPAGLNSAVPFISQYEEQLEKAALINNNRVMRFYKGDNKSFGIINDSTGAQIKAWQIQEGYSLKMLTYSQDDSIAIYYFDSFFSPSTVYKINVNTLEQSPLSKTYVRFNTDNISTEIVHYYSKDSTLIPMYITHKKGIKLDGNNPVILYGYGGFGISMKPFFEVNNNIFLNNGGIFAAPCLRGGGDFPGWHEQGERLNKQNTFDDFIYAAQYLISEKYTNAGKIAAMGGSNGGLVVGACMVQRPDLFKVVVSQSGVFDMLRYHLYNIGYGYADEFGNISDSLDFENLRHYSPVQNVKKDVDYPATLLVASDNDDRVLPFHSFKFISQLQAKGTGKNPYILYYQEKAGHSGSALFNERIQTDAYIYSFIYKELGIERKIRFDVD